MQIPELKYSRITYGEGGLLNVRREYLRVLYVPGNEGSTEERVGGMRVKVEYTAVPHLENFQD
jgi:hypothetical protein